MKKSIILLIIAILVGMLPLSIKGITGKIAKKTGVVSTTTPSLVDSSKENVWVITEKIIDSQRDFFTQSMTTISIVITFILVIFALVIFFLEQFQVKELIKSAKNELKQELTETLSNKINELINGANEKIKSETEKSITELKQKFIETLTNEVKEMEKKTNDLIKNAREDVKKETDNLLKEKDKEFNQKITETQEKIYRETARSFKLQASAWVIAKQIEVSLLFYKCSLIYYIFLTNVSQYQEEIKDILKDIQSNMDKYPPQLKESYLKGLLEILITLNKSLSLSELTEIITLIENKLKTPSLT